MPAHALSRVGPRHATNEDAFRIAPDLPGGAALYLVSDGVGGRAGGEVASRYVSKALPARLGRVLEEGGCHSLAACADQLTLGVRQVSRQLFDHALKMPGLAGMTATLAMLLRLGREAYVAHLGDSRVYLLREGALECLTQDHTVVDSLLAMGDLSQTQAGRHPGRHQLTRCMGMARDPMPDVQLLDILPGDRFLLCSDGVSKPLGDARLRDILSRDGMPNTIAHALLEAVAEAKGRDDATAVVFFV